jgi:hypothetical protein
MKVFISHSSKDKKFVRTLKDDLNENGIETFFDEDSLDLGDSLKERLDVALDESDYFLIILSPSAVASDWVKYELNEAIKLFNNKTLNKIIPIKYRECIFPKELEKLLYADLSQEVVQIKSNKLKLLGTGYSKFLQNLIKSLRNSSNKLTSNDKSLLKKDIAIIEDKNQQKQLKKATLTSKIIRFKDAKTVELYQMRIAKTLNTVGHTTYSPIILPPIFRMLFEDLKLGDKLIFNKQNKHFIIGHFAGFRTGDSGMAIDPRIRKSLNLNVGYQRFLIDIEKRQLTII